MLWKNFWNHLLKTILGFHWIKQHFEREPIRIHEGVVDQWRYLRSTLGYYHLDLSEEPPLPLLWYDQGLWLDLLKKLQALGVDGIPLKWIVSYLRDGKLVVNLKHLRLTECTPDCKINCLISNQCGHALRMESWPNNLIFVHTWSAKCLNWW